MQLNADIAKRSMESFTKLKDHYSKDSREFSKKNTKEHILAALPFIMSDMYKRREGFQDKSGQTIVQDVSLNDVTKSNFGIGWREFMHDLGVNTMFNSISDILKFSGMTPSLELVKSSLKYGQGSVYATTDINDAFRFIIPEVILQLVRTAYEETANYQNWINATITVARRNGIKVPRVERGDTMPVELQEGQSIPLGAVQFGQKIVDVKKYGLGMGITKELMEESSIDMVAEFLRSLGSDMNIGENSKARDVLINGEQADLSESAAVIGVESVGDGFQHIDIDRVTSQFTKLNMSVGAQMGSTANMLLDLNATKPERERETLRAYAGVPDYQYNLPDAATVMMFDPSRAMNRLQFGSMMVESQYNPKRQVDEAYVSFWSGFYINKRDARVLIKNDVTFAAQGWPSFMDVDALRLEEYREF